MTSQRAVLESLNVTARQMSRRGSSDTAGNSGGGALIAQLEDMNQRFSNIAARAADIRFAPTFINNIINNDCCRNYYANNKLPLVRST